MAFRHEQVLIAGMLIDGLCFNLHIAKPDHPADVGEAAGQLRLRLERDHPAIPDPPRQPVDEAALVGADITGNIARPEVPPDNAELGSLIAKQGLQRPGPKPDTLGRKPGLENGHGSAFRFCDNPAPPGMSICDKSCVALRSVYAYASLKLRRTLLRPDGLRMAAPSVARKGEAWWGKKDSNLRSHKTADLQSAPFATRDTPPLNSIATHPPKWRRQGHG